MQRGLGYGTLKALSAGMVFDALTERQGVVVVDGQSIRS
jgi:hypothetical protein